MTSGPSQGSGKQSATCGLGGPPPARRRKAARTKPGTAMPSDQPGTAGHAACDSADAHGPTQAESRSWTAEQGPPRARCLLGATAVATLRRQTGASELHIEKWLKWQVLCEMCFPKNKNKKPKMRCEGYIFKTKKRSDFHVGHGDCSSPASADASAGPGAPAGPASDCLGRHYVGEAHVCGGRAQGTQPARHRVRAEGQRVGTKGPEGPGGLAGRHPSEPRSRPRPPPTPHGTRSTGRGVGGARGPRLYGNNTNATKSLVRPRRAQRPPREVSAAAAPSRCWRDALGA